MLTVLIDSGAAGRFIDQKTAQDLGFPVRPLLRPCHIQSIDGSPIGGGIISHCTAPLVLEVSALHQETIVLYVTDCAQHSVILGLPWLELHNPQVSWADKEVTQWSLYFLNNCLNFPIVPLAAMTVESPTTLTPVTDPPKYQDLREVFSKERASGLPPHRPYDCAIELLPRPSPPRSHVYPLSQAEHQAMEEYIQEVLQQGYIRSSTSPASAGFFFVEKKGGGL